MAQPKSLTVHIRCVGPKEREQAELAFDETVVGAALQVRIAWGELLAATPLWPVNAYGRRIARQARLDRKRAVDELLCGQQGARR